MSFIRQYPFIIILLSFQLYLCQQQDFKLLNDDNINNTSSFNETFTTGKLFNSINTRIERIMHFSSSHILKQEFN
jgi:hypothetical protein